MIVALAGGVGGAKLAQGLLACLPPGALSVIVNTGDDFELFGLRISPDLDTVLYTLAGIANPATGWGIVGDTWATMEMLGRYGQPTWFQLGDRDLATHITRTERLRAGERLSEIMADMGARLGIDAALLPMCDEPVATMVDTSDGQLEFQDYFVRRQQQDDVLGVSFRGIEQARALPAAVASLEEAEAIVICPSNPFVSVGPILAVPGLRDALLAARAPRVAVSPIVGGRAIKGPAAKMLITLGHEVSPVGVARLYEGVIDGIVIDSEDSHCRPHLEAMGLAVLVTGTIMGDRDDRARLAGETIAFCRSLRRARG